MSQRYQVNEGVVIKRLEMTNGDVIVTLMGEHGKWQAKAKKGKRLGGHVGKLSLFHDVTAQYYKKGEDGLAVLTQVQLNGALPKLADPNLYIYAHILAELVDKLTVDIHIGEDIYTYFVSALRGLSIGKQAEDISIVYIWKLLQTAGLSPRLQRCVICRSSDLDLRFDIALGGLSCASCGRGIAISEDVVQDLQAIHSQTVRTVLAEGLSDYKGHFRLIRRYLQYHVGDLNSLASLHSFGLLDDD